MTPGEQICHEKNQDAKGHIVATVPNWTLSPAETLQEVQLLLPEDLEGGCPGKLVWKYVGHLDRGGQRWSGR